LPEVASPPSLEKRASFATLEALLRRAEQLVLAVENAGAWNDAEFDDLLTQAAKAPPTAGAALAVGNELLYQLGYYTGYLAQTKSAANAAARLAAIHRAWRQHHVPGAFPLAAARAYGEACWRSADYSGLAAAIEAAEGAVDRDDGELAMVHALDVRLQTVLGRLDAASRAAAAAERAAERSGDAGVVCHVALAVADAHLVDGDYGRARATLAKLPADDTHRRFYETLIGALLDDAGALDRAAEAPVAPIHRSMWFTKLAKAALLRGDDAAAERCIDALLELLENGFDDHEGQAASLALELALRRGTPDPTTVDRGREVLRRLSTQWRATPRPAGGIGFLQLDDRATLLANVMLAEVALVPGAVGAEAALRHLVAAHAAEHGVDADGGEPLPDGWLSGEHGFVAFVPGTFRSVQLVRDGAGTAVHELGPAPLLRALAADLRDAVEVARSGGATEPLQQQRARCRDALLPASVAKRLTGWRHISVCGADMLGSVPLALLPGDAATGVELGAIAVIDHEDNLFSIRDRGAAKRRGTVVFAASLLASTAGVPSFAVPQQALGACVDPYQRRGADVSVFVDGAATRAAVNASAPRARLVHLVGHGVSNRQRADVGGIAFSDDATGGSLWGADVARLDLTGVSVILGACHAGVGPARRGGDPLATGLAGALRRAGARCVLVPTTAIDVHRHFAAMAKVHAAFADGATLGEALLAARRDPELDARTRLELLLMELHGSGR